MNKKIFYIAIGLAIAIIGAMIYILLTLNKTDKKIAVPNNDGSTTSVNDFTKTAQKNDAAAYTLTDKQESAVIMYNQNSNIFTILVHANEEEEFNQKRLLAEVQFLTQLGITEQDACKLKVEVATDGPETDLLPFTKAQKLSFCK